MSNSRGSPAPSRIAISPQEEALQSLCKPLLKSRIFQGNYKERRYVAAVGAYRDIILLYREEKELEKLLLDLRHKLQLFYSQIRMWIGITHCTEAGISWQQGSLQTCIWVELDDLAFGQYWFSVKSLRFRQNEIILKLKMLRPADNDTADMWTRRRLSSTSSVGTTRNSAERQQSGASIKSRERPTEAISSISNAIKRTELSGKARTDDDNENHIGFNEFVQIVEHWGISIKHTLYDFMSNDVSKDNIKGVFRFIGLLIVSLLSGALAAIKFLGIFVLRFMFEFSRLTHVLTPIIIKIIDVLNKMVGGFYILLAMIWRDVVRGRQPKQNAEALEYKPAYKSIQYGTQANTQRYQFTYQGSQNHDQQSNMTDFERKFQ